MADLLETLLRVIFTNPAVVRALLELLAEYWPQVLSVIIVLGLVAAGVALVDTKKSHPIEFGAIDLALSVVAVFTAFPWAAGAIDAGKVDWLKVLVLIGAVLKVTSAYTGFRKAQQEAAQEKVQSGAKA